MNRRSLRWRRRYLAYAAALGALASFVGPVRPAIAKGATPAADAVTITVTIPRLNGNGPPGNGGPGGEGVLTMTVTDAPVELGPGTPSADGQTILFTGQLPPMTISDSRNVGRPGWTVTGQVSDFSGGGEGFSGSQLGWTPAIVTQNAKRNVKVGPTVDPGTDPGLRGGFIMASAGPGKGLGSVVIGATLDLEVPADISIGSQAATFSVTIWSTDKQH